MILAAPLVIPFAEAVGISIATLGMAKVADMVNEYIQENPEQSMKILSTIVPGVGIGEIFMKKGKDEEVEEDIEVEEVDARDLTKKEKAKKMKELAKSGASREKMIKGYEEIILPGKEDEMLDEAEDRYEGGVEEVTRPKFDYKKFFKKRYADGGRVGLFMGGSPLEGQALSIYNSMNAYGFSDQEIANALEGQGLYTPSGSSTPETTAPNIINQQIQSGGGGGGITTLDPLTRPQGTPFNLNSLTKTKFGYNNTLGKTIEGVKDFTGSMIDKFSGSKVGEGATKFKNFAITPMMALMQKRNPLNPGASNYNPNLQKQMDFLEGQTGTKITGTSGNLKFTDDQMMIGRDPNSGLAKYGPGSVLEGQNVVSGFGTNDYEEQLGNYIERMRNRAITKTLSKFQQAKLDAAIAEMGREMERQQREVAERARAANPDVYARADELGFTDGKGGGFASKSTGTNEAFSNKTGRGRTGYGDGGLATMFKEKR